MVHRAVLASIALILGCGRPPDICRRIEAGGQLSCEPCRAPAAIAGASADALIRRAHAAIVRHELATGLDSDGHPAVLPAFVQSDARLPIEAGVPVRDRAGVIDEVATAARDANWFVLATERVSGQDRVIVTVEHFTVRWHPAPDGVDVGAPRGAVVCASLVDDRWELRVLSEY